MSKRYDPSPIQLQLGLDAPPPRPTLQVMEGITLKYDCPRPLRVGQDQYRCTLCGLVWDVDEAKPPCQRTDVHPSNREDAP